MWQCCRPLAGPLLPLIHTGNGRLGVLAAALLLSCCPSSPDLRPFHSLGAGHVPLQTPPLWLARRLSQASHPYGWVSVRCSDL